jgi:hypothetical protein
VGSVGRSAERDPAERAEQCDYDDDHRGPQARWFHDHDKHNGQEGGGYRVRYAPQGRIEDPPAQITVDRAVRRRVDRVTQRRAASPDRGACRLSSHESYQEGDHPAVAPSEFASGQVQEPGTGQQDQQREDAK